MSGLSTAPWIIGCDHQDEASHMALPEDTRQRVLILRLSRPHEPCDLPSPLVCWAYYRSSYKIAQTACSEQTRYLEIRTWRNDRDRLLHWIQTFCWLSFPEWNSASKKPSARAVSH